MIGGNFNREPVRFSASYTSSALLAAGGVVTIVTPASNVNGLILWRAGLLTNSAALNAVALLAKASAPTGLADGELLVAGTMRYANVPEGHFVTEEPVFITAGKGLYVYSQSLEIANSLKWAMYSVL